MLKQENPDEAQVVGPSQFWVFSRSFFGASTVTGSVELAVLGGSAVTNAATPTILNGNLGVRPGSAVTGFFRGLLRADRFMPRIRSRPGANRPHYSVQPVSCYSLHRQLDRLRPWRNDPTSGGLLVQYIRAVNGHPHSERPKQSQCHLRFHDRERGSSVLLINNASSCGVAWQVGSSATLGTGTSLVGNIVALTSITLNTGASLPGRLLARNGAVTLDNEPGHCL